MDSDDVRVSELVLLDEAGAVGVAGSHSGPLIWTCAKPQSVLAERIVEHRGAQGFRAVADLRDVPGIGEKTFQELAPLVSV